MPPNEDWTTGPAKWGAVIVLGGASIVGMAWSMTTRSTRAPAAPVAPAVVVSDGEPEQGAAGAVESSGSPRPARTPTAAKKINVNTAPESELELLPRIGPALAARIVEYRTKNGPFRAVDDLVNVKGVGPLTLEKLRPLVTVD